MWKELKWDNLEVSSEMLRALNHLDSMGIRSSDIKIASYPSVEIFYYVEDF